MHYFVSMKKISSLSKVHLLCFLSLTLPELPHFENHQCRKLSSFFEKGCFPPPEMGKTFHSFQHVPWIKIKKKKSEILHLPEWQPPNIQDLYLREYGQKLPISGIHTQNVLVVVYYLLTLICAFKETCVSPKALWLHTSTAFHLDWPNWGYVDLNS